MKKSIKIFSIVFTTLSLMAFGIINWDDSVTDQVETSSSTSTALDNQNVEDINYQALPDSFYFGKQVAEDLNEKAELNFFYDVGPRFGAIKKGELDKARSINDFLSKEQTQQVVSYKSVSVIIVKNDKQTDIRETGYTGILTDAQIDLLQSSDYSTNFLIRATYQEKNMETGELEYSYATPHLTIIPEKQAVYVSGKDALIEYLSENNKENTTNLNKGDLQPAKLYFTVSKKGTISSIKLDRTSGYPSIDRKMIELITKTQGKWEPAENFKGEKVDQELVISFGIVGC